MSVLSVTQRRSRNGANSRQLDTLRSLGLRRIGHTVHVEDCEQARGMLHAVRHLIEVNEDERAAPKSAGQRAPKTLKSASRDRSARPEASPR
jgi:large subunit ribosomal protein L30